MLCNEFQVGLGVVRTDPNYNNSLGFELVKAIPQVAGLHSAGFDVFEPSGTYFVTVDIRGLRPDGDGFAFCRELPDLCGVVGIPNVVFYDRSHEHEGRHMVRFAFCKRPESIDEAVTRLMSMSGDAAGGSR